ncbi:ATP-binding cassette domain-containing protein [Chitinispirillales bacterium ANBcel5]|uniref:ATP-binding cassette domain-containing protein n=1 Tax=Cellulosispirillum alkaliphilum TaxID=3039283 RepID=UPI002A51FBC3|nr:ATP-binding cassette domain-containing protein [Chitinispirillales bacterium ANBcel5]
MELVLKKLRYRAGEKVFYYDAGITFGIAGITGISGAGKTTLFKIIAGVVRPFSGQLTIDNKVIFDKKRKIDLPIHKRNIGTVFQQNYLFPHLSVIKNLTFSQNNLSHKHMAHYEETIQLLKIGHLLEKKPKQISGGECQRVAIGRALIQKPELLLLDEPLSNLDKNQRNRIISYLLKIHERFSLPMMIISHDLEDIRNLTERIIVIENGTIANGRSNVCQASTR